MALSNKITIICIWATFVTQNTLHTPQVYREDILVVGAVILPLFEWVIVLYPNSQVKMLTSSGSLEDDLRTVSM